jgi:hypothetical protein
MNPTRILTNFPFQTNERQLCSLNLHLCCADVIQEFLYVSPSRKAGFLDCLRLDRPFHSET